MEALHLPTLSSGRPVKSGVHEYPMVAIIVLVGRDNRFARVVLKSAHAHGRARPRLAVGNVSFYRGKLRARTLTKRRLDPSNEASIVVVASLVEDAFDLRINLRVAA